MVIEPSFNIRHFAALTATVRHGTVTKAARTVNLTQPALTQAIARLEATLGTILFERSSGGMAATPAALLLAARAEAAIGHIGSPRVTATQVRAFLAVARAGSYAGAAETSGLSPPALHRAVADLSIALGQRLIDRRGRSIALTAAGRRRARGFGLAMAELRAGLAELAALRGEAGGRIVIGAMPLSRARWLPATITRFVAVQPSIDIVIIEGSHAELAGPLRDGEIDLMLGALRPGPFEDLAQEPVFEDRPGLVMRAGHPLLAAPVLDGAALTSFPWILPGARTPLRQLWEAMISASGAEPPHIGIECSSVLALRHLLLANDALTLLSPDQVELEVEAGLLAIRPMPLPVDRTIGITTRASWRPTADQIRFLEILRETGAPKR